MLISESLDVARQNAIATDIAGVMTNFSPVALGAYLAHQVHVDAIKAINNTSTDDLVEAFASLHASHGVVGIGAYGNMLNVALVQAAGVNAQVIARDGDISIPEMNLSIESKTSVRGWRGYASKPSASHLFRFSRSQIVTSAPQRVSMTVIEVTSGTANVGFFDTTVAFIAKAAALSRQRSDGHYVLSMPAHTATEGFAPRGRLASLFAGSYTSDTSQHQANLIAW